MLYLLGIALLAFSDDSLAEPHTGQVVTEKYLGYGGGHDGDDTNKPAAPKDKTLYKRMASVFTGGTSSKNASYYFHNTVHGKCYSSPGEYYCYTPDDNTKLEYYAGINIMHVVVSNGCYYEVTPTTAGNGYFSYLANNVGGSKCWGAQETYADVPVSLDTLVNKVPKSNKAVSYDQITLSSFYGTCTTSYDPNDVWTTCFLSDGSSMSFNEDKDAGKNYADKYPEFSYQGSNGYTYNISLSQQNSSYWISRLDMQCCGVYIGSFNQVKLSGPIPSQSPVPSSSGTPVPSAPGLRDGTYAVAAFQGVLQVTSSGYYAVLTQGSEECFFTINYALSYSGANNVTLNPYECTPSGKSSCYCFEQDTLTGTYVANSQGGYTVDLVTYGTATLELSKKPATYIPPCTYTAVSVDGLQSSTTIYTQGSSSRAVTTTHLEYCTFTTYDQVYYTGGMNATIADVQACVTQGPSDCYCSASGVISGQYSVSANGTVYLSADGVQLLILTNPQNCQEDTKKSLTGGDDVLIFSAAGAGLAGMLLFGFWCYRRRNAESEVSLNTVENQGANLPYEQIQ